MNAFGILKASPWSNGRETTILGKDHMASGETVKDMLVLFDGLLKTMKVNKDRMYQLTMEGFSTTTELADTLVREYGFPFRTAHEIVGLVAKKAMEAGKNATTIGSDLIERCIEAHTGQPMRIDPQHVKNALEPFNNINVRSLPGGPAPAEVRRMIAERRPALQACLNFLSQKKAQIDRAGSEMSKMVASVIGRGG
jgi:argininosuccinate lyase